MDLYCPECKRKVVVWLKEQRTCLCCYDYMCKECHHQLGLTLTLHNRGDIHELPEKVQKS
jgi:hypothetical protein